MINMSGKFQRNHSSRSPWLESLSKFSCEIVLEFQISKLLWGRTSNQNLAELPPVLIFLVIISAKMLESSIWALIQGSLQSQYLFLELEATYRRKSRWRCLAIIKMYVAGVSAKTVQRDISKMSRNKSFDFRSRFGAIYSASKIKKYLLNNSTIGNQLLF